VEDDRIKETLAQAKALGLLNRPNKIKEPHSPLNAARLRWCYQSRLQRLNLVNDQIAQDATEYAIWLTTHDFFVCAYCGSKPAHIAHSRHIDHITPLSRGGSHTAENLAPACAACNRAKAAKPAATPPVISQHLTVDVWRGKTLAIKPQILLVTKELISVIKEAPKRVYNAPLDLKELDRWCREND
jgi:5-methylcytosine-specific restriction endonuclease McrA